MITMTGAHPSAWGFIPSFLNENDPRTAKEQFNTHYISGWRPFDGFEFKFYESQNFGTLKYPGDPIMKSLGTLKFRDEMVLLFPSSWIVVIDKDGKHEVCRMD